MQDTRHIRIDSPLGPDVLLARSFRGRERLSSLFEYELEMISTEDDLDYSKIVGELVSVGIRHSVTSEEFRYVSGHVMRFSAAGFDKQGRVYRAVLVPWAWFLTCASNCRIFQEMKVKEIIEAVLVEHGSDFEFRLTGTYEMQEYCVQYNETDFAFISRLMEECGIYYWFEQGEKSHKLILSDDRSKFDACEEAEVPFREGSAIENSISIWDHQYEFRAGKFTHRDYHFHTPSLKVEKSEPSTLKTSDKAKHELYEYPGGWARTKDTGSPLKAEDLFTRVRMEAEESPHNVVQGQSTCLTFHAGLKFKLTEHPVSGEDGDYVFTAVEWSCTEGSYASGGGGGGGLNYTNSFRCIPSDVPYRPARTTPRPRVRGVQTAVVVGPSGEEIYVDEWGRVKVQFHWDREGKHDESSSCWMRVAQSAAGAGWGIVFNPRIGQEVVVSFVEGDPDRPLITGLVYNAEVMPPYKLPDDRTRSTIKTHSTLKGDAKTFNELRFEDKKGEEEIYFHAEKDFNRVVENDDTLKVGFDDKDKGDQRIEIFNNRTMTVGKSGCADGSMKLTILKDRTIELTEGNDKLAVVEGDRDVKIKGDENYTIETGQKVTVTKDQKVTIKSGNHELLVSSGKSLYKAAQKIEIKVGGSSITLDPMGVTIKATMIKIIGQAMLDAKAPMAKVTGSALLTLKGGLTKIN